MPSSVACLGLPSFEIVHQTEIWVKLVLWQQELKELWQFLV